MSVKFLSDCSEALVPQGGSIVIISIYLRLSAESQTHFPSGVPVHWSPYHWSLHHTHLSASGLLIEASSHLSSKVL